MFEPFNSHDTSRQSKGGRNRALAMSPERRQMVSRAAAYKRWYTPTGDALERVECYLRFYAKAVARALAEGNEDRAIRASAAMLAAERMKVALQAASMKDVTPVATEKSSGIDAKLAATRKRRNAALAEPIDVESKPADKNSGDLD